jgi:hypothetical protein
LRCCSQCILGIGEWLPIPHVRGFWCGTFPKHRFANPVISAISVGHLPRPVLRELWVVLSHGCLLTWCASVISPWSRMAKIGGITYPSDRNFCDGLWLAPDRWMAAGESPPRGRKTFTRAGVICASIFIALFCDCQSLSGWFCS